MERAFQLAEFASNHVASNPNVGAVLVYKNMIIGEGYHKYFGDAHAEVNAIESVPIENKFVIADSTFYISLEPCCFHGKTPACTDLIVKSKIKEVYVGRLDPNPKVSGRGIRILRSKGIKVHLLNEFKFRSIIDPFLANQKNRPYVILKWASSEDHYIGFENKRVLISNSLSQIYTHHIRALVDGVLIGSKTLKTDSPELNTRVVKGNHPIRIVLGNHIQKGFSTYDRRDLYLGSFLIDTLSNRIILDSHNLHEVLKTLYSRGVNRLLVEGGKIILSEFIKLNLWDKAIIIQSEKRLENKDIRSKKIKAPQITGNKINELKFRDDRVIVLERSKHLTLNISLY